MSRRFLILPLLLLTLTAIIGAQTTQFGYQGSLNAGGTPANGDHDFEFALFDSPTGGSQLGSILTRTNVAVTNGIFSVTLDFGSQFPGATRFLEIRVRPSGQPGITILSPRQQINTVPHAIKSISSDSSATAANATNAAIAQNSLQLGGVPANQYVLASDPRMTDPRNPLPNSANYIQNQSAGPQASSSFNVSGNGTVGGTLSSNIVNAVSQYRIAGNRVLSTAAGGSLIAGVGAGAATTGGSNSFFGTNSGAATTTGPNNSFVGFNAGAGTTTGSGNSFFGTAAGFANIIGNNNSAFGINAGSSSTSAVNNAFFGAFAGASNTANSNSFFGAGAGQVNTSGTGNAFFGRSSGEDNTTGSSNSFFGASSGFRNTTGNNNAFFGVNAGGVNTTGFNNAYFGAGAGDVATDSDNSFFGANAGGGSGNSGNANTFVGSTAGVGNTTGSLNTFVGAAAGLENDTGDNNSIFGTNAGLRNHDGSENSFFGVSAGSLNVSSAANSFFGFRAGQNTGGSGPASSNSFFGHRSGAANREGAGNTFVGKSAGELNTSGTANTFVGLFAGNTNTIGNNNTLLGRNSDVGANNLTYATAIGAEAIVTTSSTIVLGRPGGSDKIVIPGLGSAGGSQLCLNASSQISLCSSSLRYKSDVAAFNSGLEIINRLRPVSFSWREGGMLDLGLVAEEVAKVQPLLTTTNRAGEIEGVKYDRVGVVLVNAVKEQQREIELLRTRNAEQDERFRKQQAEINALKKLICVNNADAEICRPVQ